MAYYVMETDRNNQQDKRVATGVFAVDKVFRGVDINGNALEVKIGAGVIKEVSPIEYSDDLPRILPVLVDTQQNGALTHAFNNTTVESVPELQRIAAHLKKNCVGRVLATFTTTDYPRLECAAAALRKIFDEDKDLNSLFPGIFHEGCFISPDKGWRGGHAPEFIIRPDYDKFCRLNELSGGMIKVVNVAPEVPGGLDFVKRAAADGIKVALGHCHPDAETIHKAVECGATIVTHFANGSAPEIHRFNNPFWGFLDDDGLALGLVGDGFHLMPEVVRTAVKCKPRGKCFMVSDANIYSGCEPGLYHRIGGLDCVIEPNGFIHVAGQEILAGAYFQQNRCVEFLTGSCGFDFIESWKMCSVYPAQIAGIHLPELKVGEEASFVICPGDAQPYMVFRGEI